MNYELIVVTLQDIFNVVTIKQTLKYLNNEKIKFNAALSGSNVRNLLFLSDQGQCVDKQREGSRMGTALQRSDILGFV